MLVNTNAVGRRWTVNEAVNWIAFRVEPLDAPTTVLPSPAAPFISVNAMGALAARVARNPKLWPGLDGVQPDPIQFEDHDVAPAYYYRTLIKRWMGRLGLSASELLVRWTADGERYRETAELVEEQQAKLSAALSELVAAAASSRLFLYGRRAKDYRSKSFKPREVIPAHYLDEIRTIDPWGNLSLVCRTDLNYMFEVEDDGLFFTDIAFDIDDVKKLWPADGLPSSRGDADGLDHGTVGRPAKLDYSDQALAAWFMLRVKQWPRKQPLPSEEEDWTAAKAEFTKVVRDRFREIRRVKTPEQWHKSGPRKARD